MVYSLNWLLGNMVLIVNSFWSNIDSKYDIFWICCKMEYFDEIFIKCNFIWKIDEIGLNFVKLIKINLDNIWYMLKELWNNRIFLFMEYIRVFGGKWN